MKNLILICLIAMVLAQQVQQKNQCNDCGQLKSQSDCEQEVTVTGSCEWVAASGTTAGKCQKKTTVDPVTSYKSYCELVDKPETNCSRTSGCAYIDSKCTHFAGCQAYVKTTTNDCQSISYFCVSDGNSCIEAKQCKEYTAQSQCESTPSISGILRCKWDTNSGACRDFACSEADTSLNTDEKCSAWLSGCVTKGQGCVNSPRPPCSDYTGDEAACLSYIGKGDENCELAVGTTNCKAKECANAKFSNDDECKAYQKGCITTGKGCIQAIQKPLCSTYSGDIDNQQFINYNVTCVGYIGSDGICEGDAGGSKCRARKCENGLFNTNDLCKQYQESCKTNGKNCVSSLQSCNTYKGTATTCAVYIGQDGYCKGTSTTTDAACAPKVCDEAPDTTTTDEACNKYQINCVTTGKGCVTRANLKSCTTYDGDNTTCQSKVGSEGKCMWKSGTKCIARDCASAQSNVNTNPLCANYFTNCVTTGSGCVSKTTCDLTVKQSSCEGTDNCSWQPICISNEKCSDFKKKSICLANSARVETFDKYDDDGNPVYIYCGWSSSTNQCKDLACSDLTGTYYNNTANCAAELSTCISNGVDACITKYDCSKLTGTQTTCENNGGYCTNISSAIDTTPCQLKKCTDNKDAADNDTCDKFKPGCISNGKGCVDYNTPCQSMKGTRDTCEKLYAFKSGTESDFKVNQCYNTESATENDSCLVKTCKLATNQDENSCGSFLEGCVYNGNKGCVDPKASDTACESYTGAAQFCESAIVKDNGAQFCFGTQNVGTCTPRACTDDTTSTKDEDCELFLSGCIAKSGGGCIAKSSRACTQQEGTVTSCSNFSGGLLVNLEWKKVGCVKYDACQTRLCADKAIPSSPTDCTDYKSSCRFLKPQSPCIDAGVCGSYSIPDTSTTEQQKFDYCTSIKDQDGLLCGYTKGATKCSVRTCDQFLSDYTNTSPTCVTYLQKNVSTTTDKVCKLAGTICYEPKQDCLYDYGTGDTTNTLKLTQCQRFVNTDNKQCTFKINDNKCSLQDSCEKLITYTNAQTCNDQTIFTSAGKCQKVTDTTCLTLSTLCSDYKIPSSVTDATKKKELCWGLYTIDNLAKITSGTAVYKKCVHRTGDQCDVITDCSDIISAQSQAQCNDYKTGCYYYGGKCYDAVASGQCPQTFPTGVTTDTQKSLYCRSRKEASTLYCQYDQANNKCITGANTDCAALTAFPASPWDGKATNASDFKSTYCLAQTYNDRSKLCQVNSGGTACEDASCAEIPSPTSQGDCDNYISGCIFYKNKCYPPGTGVNDADACANKAKVPMGLGLTAAEDKLGYCQQFYKTDDKSIYCTYDSLDSSPPTQCVVAADDCSTYNASASQTYCESKINKKGQKCKFTTGNACRDFDCYDIQNPTSQVDCDLGAPGKTCVYLLGTCYNKAALCTDILAKSGAEKTYCDQVTAKKDASNISTCTYISGTKCAIEQDCHLYTVTTNQSTICPTLTDASGNKCTYLRGNNCVQLGACSSYNGNTTPEKGPEAGSEADQCKAVKSIDKYPCIMSGAKLCKAQACTDNDASATDCANNAADCLYYSNKCIAKTDCSSYTAVGGDDTAKQAWCEGVQNLSGDLCAWDSNLKNCKDRQCSDKQFQTDFDCQSYLKACKTNGYTCVNLGNECNTFSGSKDYCEYLLDKTGKDKCKPTATASTQSSTCVNKRCFDNVSAESDPECEAYLSGCVTRGKGCISNTEPCTSYRGIKSDCEKFKQLTGYEKDKNNKPLYDKPIYKYCSGDANNTATSKCKERTCADNITDTDDKACDIYLNGCITKGTGCIDATSLCTVFKGNQATCAKFFGNSGKDYCWNTDNAQPTTNCAKKKCSDIVSKSNDECESGMPRFKKENDPNCVFDGTTCIEYGKTCIQFSGTEETCPTFLAKDGPCKATTVGTIKGACAKRVCSEAPNTLTTDADCYKYHKDCSTTGYGCTSAKRCNNLTSQASCKLRAECTWTNQCTNSITTCSSYNNSSYSQCVNSKVNGKFCAWQESNSTCRAQVCEDQPATINSHKQCQEFAQTCTTTGAGCITISACSSYRTQSICVAASTDKEGLGRCGWDTATNKCRARICSDKNGLTDDECNTFLAGCKTNGAGCVSGASCTEFTIKQFCIKSKISACLWVNGQCHDYERCENVVKKTHSECQAFSPLCTTNGELCIPITSCASTTLKASCVVGTDGACGWLPTGKCQKFGQCTDAVATSNADCESYGLTCMTDGTTCIAKSTCSNYKTKLACDNNGTDGICYWNPTTTACKLKECSDEQKGTNELCSLISVTGSKCTTDGIKCIPLSICSSYLEAGCFTGTDGECIFASPVGTTTGTTTKSCRLRQCEDISGGTTNSNCNGVILGKNCVSNGTSCIPMAACSSYKNITSCNGGGLENNKQVVCAFTPTGTDKAIGTCKAFSACADANKDILACKTNPTCKWTENSTEKSCVNHTCDTFATGTDCRPIPSFDGTSYTVCVLQNGKCTAADPGTMTDNKICYTKSAYTYSWNAATNKCESCISGSVNPNNSNGTSNQTNNGTTTTDSAFILSAISLGILGLMA